MTPPIKYGFAASSAGDLPILGGRVEIDHALTVARGRRGRIGENYGTASAI